ncbi:cyclin N-terminal domain-containing protein 1 [Caerostris extrusa]|uniref:Cyclin N-terminal domain-containing protein 1 n=1 Tax=Caerostris extrusa TaxID=172846 RepID=A0AAV4PNH2_CAEEX|nr:cyclin N-terminal domain-containing protein 1 [Caerostris extrusa]
MSAPILTEVKNIRKIPFDLLEESLFYMAKRNQERIRSAISLNWNGHLTSLNLSSTLASIFKLEKSVKYVALEIYERFLAYHVLELRQSVKDRQETDRPLSWEVIEERITEQTVLRVLTSIQLASKLSSHYDHVLPTQVAEFLEKSGGKSLQ